MSIYDEFPEIMDDAYVDGFNFLDCWTVLNPDKHFSKRDIAVALIRAEGNLTIVSKLLKRPRRSIETFILRNIDLRDLQEDVEESFIDQIEMLYKTDAKNGDTSARKFFLVTKAKNRGYVTRNEVGGKEDAPDEELSNARELLADRLANLIERSGKGENPEQPLGKGGTRLALGLESLGETEPASTDGHGLADVADHGGEGVREDEDRV